MGMHTVARVAEAFQGTFECSHCDYEVIATVFASSSGAARGVGMHAERAALEDAEQDASALASRTLQFVPCPKCGRSDPTGRSYRVQATVGSIVLGLLTSGLFYLYAMMRSTRGDDASTARWASIAFGVFFTGLLYWRWGRPWRSPEKRTVFHRRAK